MQTESIVLGKQSFRGSFMTALQRCEQRNKIPPGYINQAQINFLPNAPAKTEVDKARAYDIEAKWIVKALRQAEIGAVIVDGDSLESGLAILNQYKMSWKVGDEVVEKLYIVVYDPEDPNKAEIVQDIKEALLLLQEFRNQNNKDSKAVFITAPGHAFNFARDLIKDTIDFPLPELEEIVEVEPDKIWPLIISKILAGKEIFIHETLLIKNPTVSIMTNDLTENQRGQINKVKIKKGF